MGNKRIYLWSQILFLLFVCMFISGSENLNHSSLSVSEIYDSESQLILSQLSREGTVNLIVGLKPAQNTPANSDSIYDLQIKFLNEFSPNSIKNLVLYKYIPYLAFSTNRQGYQALLNNTMVASIERNKTMQPSLSNTASLIGANTARELGYNGSGVKIAVLDTGIFSDNPFLTNKVVGEACFSKNWGGDGSSLCPDGNTTSTAEGSGTDCNSGYFSQFSITNDSCWHGTHIAGIIAGKDQGSNLYGIAPEARLISIQVFSYVPPGVVKAYQADVNLALEHIISLYDAGDHSIAAVNLSLEYNDSTNKKYTSTNTCDTDWASTKALIDALASRNIAVIVSSGDNSYTDGMKAPGCISSAISVGATTKSDTVASYTNSANFLDLVAPGHLIYSSWAAGYGTASGTSQAAAHVSGAWALLRQKDPTLTVAEGLSALKDTAKNVTDTRNNLVLKRVQIDSALNQLGPRPVTLISPIDGKRTSNRTPTFQWQPSPNAVSYKIKVWLKSDKTVLYENWLTSEEANCASGTCSVTPQASLGLGEMEWKVIGRDSSLVEGVWSDPGLFFIKILPPNPIAPNGEITTFRPTYQWEEIDGATKYQIYVVKDGEDVASVNLWVLVNDITCDGGVCSYRPNISLKSGSYNWWMRSYNPYAAYSTWSDSLAFQTPPPPDVPTILSPTNLQAVNTFTPTYVWTKEEGATSYFLYVLDTNNVVYIKSWYSLSQIQCDDAQCSLTPNIMLGSGTYRAWVKAAHEGGKSDWSEPVEFTTPQKPAPVTLISPTGKIKPTGYIVDWQPILKWNPSEYATKYQVYLFETLTNVVVINTKITTGSAKCYGGSGTCELDIASLGITLKAGPYTWWVRAQNPAGYSAWSNALTFYPPKKPDTVNLIGPTGSINTTQPTFEWARSGRALSYKLVVYKVSDSSIVYSKTVYPQAAGCNVGASLTCSYQPTFEFPENAYKWRVYAKNPSGQSAWSVYMEFTTPNAPTAPNLISPLNVKAESNAPYYRWSVVDNATSYILKVKDKLTGEEMILKEYSAETLGCQAGSGSDVCTIHPEVFLTEDREYNWWVAAKNTSITGPWSTMGTFIAGPDLSGP